MRAGAHADSLRAKRQGRQRPAQPLAAGLLASWLLAWQAAAMAADTAPLADLPDLAPIRAQVYSAEYDKAAQALRQLIEQAGDNAHPDVYNLLGFSLRKLQRYDEAAHAYQRALYFDATHRAALEYQGELFIATGDIDAAQKNHRYLKILCGAGDCPERQQLATALREAGQAPQEGD
ncbi:tetratricopeptide repeat protein [Corticibacter populi]|uniref:Tetratricopeptide repeat protein n=1 Tax=Corticibacter populi TaxID=1550736 RepID=A0A3M6QV59_9BURK|nr:tetratricopeptide repeat protein [Corticibacter populi]RMX06449.1 tetratricopeptide repeat protein [Corticibacter populi]RZS31997.1 tetratricopeptide repeat protein [Corticibacter populi]